MVITAKQDRYGQHLWWVAYINGEMLRDKRGVGRLFKTEAAALKAARATPDPHILLWRQIAAEFIAEDRIARERPRRVLFTERGNVTDADRHQQAQGSNYAIRGWGR